MFTLGLAQCCHPADGDVIALVDSWARRAQAASVDLLVFPESLMTPFDASADQFAQSAQPLDGPFCTAIDCIAARYGLWMIYTANERNEHNRPFNTAVIVDDEGKRRAVYRKVHLFDTDFVRESKKVSAGDRLFKPIETPFGKIGLGICYDLRFPEQARAAALEMADIMIYPSAWVDGPLKVRQWRTLLAARAIENEMFVAGLSRCDRAFGRAALDYAGNSCVFGPLGEELAKGGITEDGLDGATRSGAAEMLVIADIDLDEIARARASMPVFDHRRRDLY